MQLTDQLKQKIDAMSYESLLREWRFAPIGSSMFQGESGDYFAARMAELRKCPDGDLEHVMASKSIGWTR